MRRVMNTMSVMLLSLGALLVGVSFVLPWANLLFLHPTGADIARFEGQLWLLPLGAVLGLVWAVYTGRRGSTTIISALAGLGAAAVPLLGLYLLSIDVQNVARVAEWLGVSNWVQIDVFQILGYGVYGTGAGIVLMLLGGLLGFTAIGPPAATPVVVLPPSVPVSAPMPPPQAGPVAALPQLSGGGMALPHQPQPGAWLVIRTGLRANQSFALEAGDNTVGRDPRRVDICLDDTTVSGQHARIRREGGNICLYDLGSTNGTFVNNHRVQQQVLTDNDVVRLGSVELVFRKG